MRAHLTCVPLWVLFAGMLACGAGQGPAPVDVKAEMDSGLSDGGTPTEPVDAAGAQPGIAPPLFAQPVVARSVTKSISGISREQLNKVLARGPGDLLRHVEINAVFANNRFLGYRISAFLHGTPGMVDLRVGDVVLQVNGHKVERPEEYYAIFQALKQATELRFDLLRDGQKQVLRYPIID